MIRLSYGLIDKFNHPLIRYVLSLALSLFICWLQIFLPLARLSPFLLTPLPIVFSTLLGGAYLGYLVMLINGFIINYYLLQPYNSFKLTTPILEQLVVYIIEGVIIVWIIESQRTIKEEIIKQRKIQNLLTKAGKVLLSSLDYNTTLNNVAKIIVPTVADWCTIDMVDRGGKIHQVVLMHSDPKKVEWANNIRQRFSYQEQVKGGVALVIKTKKSKLFPNISHFLLEKSIKNKEFLGIIKNMGIKSTMIVPILVANKSIGAITFVSSSSQRKYDHLDLRFAEDLANRMGQAIENSRLYLQAKDEIEERKEAERDLQEAKEQLEVILQNVTDGITVQDKDEKLVFVNDAAARLAGFTSRQSMLQIFNTPVKVSKYFERYEMKDKDGNLLTPDKLTNRRVLKGEQKPEAIIQYYDKQTGEIKWSLTRSRPVFDDNNKIHFVVTIITDISKEKEIERKKDEFISIASHELKTPLTSIKAYTQLLKLKLAAVLNTKFSSYLIKMDKQIDRLVSLVSELLDVTKIQSGKLSLSHEVFDCRELVNDVLDSMRLTTAKHKFSVIGPKKLYIKADRGRIEQVFNNLLINAVKYSPEGGTIEVSLVVRNKNLQVKVKDEGLGISREEQATIFDRFNQTQAKRKAGLSGLGLGLYITSEINKRHSGKIWVESEQNKGTIFIFNIPTGSG